MDMRENEDNLHFSIFIRMEPIQILTLKSQLSLFSIRKVEIALNFCNGYNIQF